MEAGNVAAPPGQSKSSKIEKLQQLLHSERQRMELLIGAVLVCVFLLSFLKALRDWLLPRIHGEVQGVPVRTIRGVAVPAARLVRVPVVVDAETVDNFTRGLPSPKSYGERVEREIFRRPMVYNSQRFQYCVPER